MSTPTRVVTIVVIAIAALSALGLATTCWCAIAGLELSDSVGTALNSYTSALIGALVGVLVNTRSTPPSVDHVRGEALRRVTELEAQLEALTKDDQT